MHVRKTVGISCCLILAAGCTICQDPYYDCGPVWSRGRCQNCDPNYRSGSVLNRHAPGTVVAQDAPRTGKPARTAADGSQESKSRPARRPLPSNRFLSARRLLDRRPRRRLAAMPRPGHCRPRLRRRERWLRPRGPRRATRAFSRLPIAAWMKPSRQQKRWQPRRKLAPRTAEQPSQYLGGWRAVAPRQDTPETASQPREVER